MKQISEAGWQIGHMKKGPGNRLSDVPGVRVGHATVRGARHATGVTVILPCEDNMYARKLVAAAHVLNGFGKTQGLVQMEELGTLETPIALTNTLNIGRVHDALTGYMIDRCRREHIALQSVNPVVGECNDARMNEITERVVTQEHVLEAIRTASADFETGDVGAGTGTVCFGLKGGIGTASRLVTFGKEVYTLGVLVQSNCGTLENLCIGSERVGERLTRKIRTRKEEPDRGSIMMVLATDLPVSSRQLGRVVRRMSAGLARCGSYFGHDSGDVLIGFSTANRIPHGGMHRVMQVSMVTEHTLEFAFEAAAEAAQEAVLNSLISAHDGVDLEGRPVFSLAGLLKEGE